MQQIVANEARGLITFDHHLVANHRVRYAETINIPAHGLTDLLERDNQLLIANTFERQSTENILGQIEISCAKYGMYI